MFGVCIYNIIIMEECMNKRKLISLFSLILGFCFILGNLQYVYAQESSADEFTLEEITVTAQKRSENQQKVAVAMDVIAADEIKSLAKTNIDDILSNVSNVMVQKASDGMRVSLRGYGDSGGVNHGQSFSSPAVAVNMDGVYSSRKDTSTGLFDLERVEVLFGPQSTMYASNSPGGIVNVQTANPRLDTYEGSGTIEYGNYNLLHTEGVVNAPLNSIMSLRAAFQTTTHDGYISNGGDDEDSKSGRLKILLQPNDKFTFTLTGEIVRSTSHMFGSNVTAFENQKDQDNPWTSTDNLTNPDHSKIKKLSGRLDWNLGFTDLSVVSAYTRQNGDRQEVMKMTTATGQNYDHWVYQAGGKEKSLEIRFASPADFFFKWLVGLNYYKSEDGLSGIDYDESGNVKVVDAYSIYDLTDVHSTEVFRRATSIETAKAIFANVTYPVTDQFRVTGGIRQSWDEYSFPNSEIRGTTNPFAPADYEDTTGMANGMEYNEPDYKVGVEYDIGANSMAYADYSTSYRVQSLGGATVTEAPPSEKLKAYSIGAKNRFLDNTLQLNASAFYYDYQNFSAGNMVWGYFGPLGPNGELDADVFDDSMIGPDPSMSTWGDGIWYGLDIQSTYLLGVNDSVNMSVSYLHSEWKDLTFDYVYPYLAIGAAFGSPVTMDMLQAIDKSTYNGKPMTNSPAWTVSLSYTHKFNFDNGASIDWRIDSKYKSDFRMTWKDEEYPLNYQESFINGDLTAIYYNPDGKFTMSAYVKNVRDYAEKRSYVGAPVYQMRIGAPRTYGGVISVKF